MIEIKLQGALKTLNTKTDHSFGGNGIIFYFHNGNVSFRKLISELNVPADYIAFVLINGSRYYKDNRLFDSVLVNGDRLEIFPLIASG